MKNVLPVMSLIGIAVLVTGCGTNNNDDGLIVITKANDGGVVSVSKGDNFEVVLSGNPTTGYQWQIAETDESLLSSSGSLYTQDSNAIGSGGTYRFQFKAIATGDVHLRLVYKRSWETAIAETFIVTVRIS